jgi:hypothetical protein
MYLHDVEPVNTCIFGVHWERHLLAKMSHSTGEIFCHKGENFLFQMGALCFLRSYFQPKHLIHISE